ncbi:unnamed protein product [Amoebophrya sp. A25]|nr:unnamed protein product [Amoebophrya sp. A25]|eukprot:GSA25T00010286001.1
MTMRLGAEAGGGQTVVREDAGPDHCNIEKKYSKKLLQEQNGNAAIASSDASSSATSQSSLASSQESNKSSPLQRRMTRSADTCTASKVDLLRRDKKNVESVGVVDSSTSSLQERQQEGNYKDYRISQSSICITSEDTITRNSTKIGDEAEVVLVDEPTTFEEHQKYVRSMFVTTSEESSEASSDPLPTAPLRGVRLGSPIEVPLHEMENCRVLYGQRAVFLHVYDLDDMTAKVNRVAMSLANAGIFHVGVEVYEDEWYFRQSNYENETGISRMKPMSHTCHAYRQSFYMGESALDQAEYWRLLVKLKGEWRGTDYNLLTKNCQDFAVLLCQLLEVAPVPDFVTKLPRFINRNLAIADDEQQSNSTSSSAATRSHTTTTVARTSHQRGLQHRGSPTQGGCPRGVSAPSGTPKWYNSGRRTSSASGASAKSGTTTTPKHHSSSLAGTPTSSAKNKLTRVSTNCISGSPKRKFARIHQNEATSRGGLSLTSPLLNGNDAGARISGFPRSSGIYSPCATGDPHQALGAASTTVDNAFDRDSSFSLPTFIRVPDQLQLDAGGRRMTLGGSSSSSRTSSSDTQCHGKKSETTAKTSRRSSNVRSARLHCCSSSVDGADADARSRRSGSGHSSSTVFEQSSEEPEGSYFGGSVETSDSNSAAAAKTEMNHDVGNTTTSSTTPRQAAVMNMSITTCRGRSDHKGGKVRRKKDGLEESEHSSAEDFARQLLQNPLLSSSRTPPSAAIDSHGAAVSRSQAKGSNKPPFSSSTPTSFMKKAASTPTSFGTNSSSARIISAKGRSFSARTPIASGPSSRSRLLRSEQDDRAASCVSARESVASSAGTGVMHQITDFFRRSFSSSAVSDGRTEARKTFTAAAAENSSEVSSSCHGATPLNNGPVIHPPRPRGTGAARSAQLPPGGDVVTRTTATHASSSLPLGGRSTTTGTDIGAGASLPLGGRSTSTTTGTSSNIPAGGAASEVMLMNQHGCTIRLPVGREAIFADDDECPYVSSSPLGRGHTSRAKSCLPPGFAKPHFDEDLENNASNGEVFGGGGAVSGASGGLSASANGARSSLGASSSTSRAREGIVGDPTAVDSEQDLSDVGPPSGKVSPYQPRMAMVEHSASLQPGTCVMQRSACPSPSFGQNEATLISTNEDTKMLSNDRSTTLIHLQQHQQEHQLPPVTPVSSASGNTSARHHQALHAASPGADIKLKLFGRSMDDNSTTADGSKDALSDDETSPRTRTSSRSYWTALANNISATSIVTNNNNMTSTAIMTNVVTGAAGAGPTGAASLNNVMTCSGTTSTASRRTGGKSRQLGSSVTTSPAKSTDDNDLVPEMNGDVVLVPHPPQIHPSVQSYIRHPGMRAVAGEQKLPRESAFGEDFLPNPFERSSASRYYATPNTARPTPAATVSIHTSITSTTTGSGCSNTAARKTTKACSPEDVGFAEDQGRSELLHPAASRKLLKTQMMLQQSSKSLQNYQHPQQPVVISTAVRSHANRGSYKIDNTVRDRPVIDLDAPTVADASPETFATTLLRAAIDEDDEVDVAGGVVFTSEEVGAGKDEHQEQAGGVREGEHSTGRGAPQLRLHPFVDADHEGSQHQHDVVDRSSSAQTSCFTTDHEVKNAMVSAEGEGACAASAVPEIASLAGLQNSNRFLRELPTYGPPCDFTNYVNYTSAEQDGDNEIYDSSLIYRDLSHLQEQQQTTTSCMLSLRPQSELVQLRNSCAMTQAGGGAGSVHRVRAVQAGQQGHDATALQDRVTDVRTPRASGERLTVTTSTQSCSSPTTVEPVTSAFSVVGVSNPSGGSATSTAPKNGFGNATTHAINGGQEPQHEDPHLHQHIFLKQEQTPQKTKQASPASRTTTASSTKRGATATSTCTGASETSSSRGDASSTVGSLDWDWQDMQALRSPLPMIHEESEPSSEQEQQYLLCGRGPSSSLQQQISTAGAGSTTGRTAGGIQIHLGGAGNRASGHTPSASNINLLSSGSGATHHLQSQHQTTFARNNNMKNSSAGATRSAFFGVEYEEDKINSSVGKKNHSGGMEQRQTLKNGRFVEVVDDDGLAFEGTPQSRNRVQQGISVGVPTFFGQAARGPSSTTDASKGASSCTGAPTTSGFKTTPTNAAWQSRAPRRVVSRTARRGRAGGAPGAPGAAACNREQDADHGDVSSDEVLELDEGEHLLLSPRDEKDNHASGKGNASFTSTKKNSKNSNGVAGSTSSSSSAGYQQRTSTSGAPAGSLQQRDAENLDRIREQCCTPRLLEYLRGRGGASTTSVNSSSNLHAVLPRPRRVLDPPDEDEDEVDVVRDSPRSATTTPSSRVVSGGSTLHQLQLAQEEEEHLHPTTSSVVKSTVQYLLGARTMTSVETAHQKQNTACTWRRNAIVSTVAEQRGSKPRLSTAPECASFL